jgi:hypothetical protein
VCSNDQNFSYLETVAENSKSKTLNILRFLVVPDTNIRRGWGPFGCLYLLRMVMLFCCSWRCLLLSSCRLPAVLEDLRPPCSFPSARFSSMSWVSHPHTGSSGNCSVSSYGYSNNFCMLLFNICLIRAGHQPILFYLSLFVRYFKILPLIKNQLRIQP